jgi:hypothetical protein
LKVSATCRPAPSCAMAAASFSEPQRYWELAAGRPSRGGHARAAGARTRRGGQAADALRRRRRPVPFWRGRLGRDRQSARAAVEPSGARRHRPAHRGQGLFRIRVCGARRFARSSINLSPLDIVPSDIPGDRAQRSCGMRNSRTATFRSFCSFCSRVRRTSRARSSCSPATAPTK